MKGTSMGLWLFFGHLTSARRHSTPHLQRHRHSIASPHREMTTAFNNVVVDVRSSSTGYWTPATKTSTFTSLSAYREKRRRSSTTTNDSNNTVNDYTQQILSNEQSARNKRHGQAKARLEKATRRENRIYHLENNIEPTMLTNAERAELEGLLRVRENFEEQYSIEGFSKEHVEFKRLHNEVFVALARYCQRDRNKRERRKRRMRIVTGDNTIPTTSGEDSESNHPDVDVDTKDVEDDNTPNVFYLDGPDMATSNLLIDNHGFDPSCCYVANRHMSTCEILQQRLPRENVLHATAAEALTPPKNNKDENDSSSGDGEDDNRGTTTMGSFSNVDFSAYYFDGCGGFTPHVIGMITAALVRPQDTTTISSSSAEQKKSMMMMQHPPKTTAIGYSLMGGNRDVVEKELHICRALTAVARTRGMRTRHVLDDPERYGIIPAEVGKTEGGTFTSWMLLEEDDE